MMAKDIIDIILLVDTREQDLGYINSIEFDKRRKSDGVKIVGYEIVTIKPRGVKVSTGDISYKYKVNEGDWINSNLSIEIKKGMDLMSSIYTKASYDRLIREIQRAKDAQLDFYFISDTDITSMVSYIKKLEPDFSRFGKSALKKSKLKANSNVLFVEKYLQLNNDLKEFGYNGIMCSGKDIWILIKRLIKNNLKKELKGGI